MDTKFIRIYQEVGKPKTIILNRNYTKEQLGNILEGGPATEDIDIALSKGIYIPEAEKLTIVFPVKSWIHEHNGDEFAVTSFEEGDEITISPDCTVTVERHSPDEFRELLIRNELLIAQSVAL